MGVSMHSDCLSIVAEEIVAEEIVTSAAAQMSAVRALVAVVPAVVASNQKIGFVDVDKSFVNESASNTFLI
jgi:hypothetical protein